jgi:hypothetical protein
MPVVRAYHAELRHDTRGASLASNRGQRTYRHPHGLSLPPPAAHTAWGLQESLYMPNLQGPLPHNSPLHTPPATPRACALRRELACPALRLPPHAHTHAAGRPSQALAVASAGLLTPCCCCCCLSAWKEVASYWMLGSITFSFAATASTWGGVREIRGHADVE